MSSVQNWRDRTAAALGFSVQTLERYQRLHRQIVVPFPELAEALNAHALGESLSSMTQVAAVKAEAGRRTLIATIVAHPHVKSVDEAATIAGLADSKGGRGDPADYVDRLRDSWRKMEPAHQRASALWVAANVTSTIAHAMVAQFKARGLL